MKIEGDTMSEHVNPGERGDVSVRALVIGSAVATLFVASVVASRELAEMPEDAYSSMEGVQVNVPSNIFEQAARDIWGMPEINTSQMNLTEAIALTADMREYKLDSEAAVAYAVQADPSLEPYKEANLPSGVTKIPLPNPEIEFIGPLQYPFMETVRPEIYEIITNPDESQNVPLQDAIYEANKRALFEGKDSGVEYSVYPAHGSYPVGVYDLSKWVGLMEGMTVEQKNITTAQANELITPPVTETTP